MFIAKKWTVIYRPYITIRCPYVFIRALTALTHPDSEHTAAVS